MPSVSLFWLRPAFVSDIRNQELFGREIVQSMFGINASKLSRLREVAKVFRQVMLTVLTLANKNASLLKTVTAEM